MVAARPNSTLIPPSTEADDNRGGATGSGAERASYAFSTIEPNVAEVEVPDDRLEVIHQFIETDKVVPARVKIVDIAGLVAGQVVEQAVVEIGGALHRAPDAHFDHGAFEACREERDLGVTVKMVVVGGLAGEAQAPGGEEDLMLCRGRVQQSAGRHVPDAEGGAGAGSVVSRPID